MRVYAISDIHVDYDENRKWINNLSKYEYKNDIIIIAGDISDNLQLIEETFKTITKRFYKAFFVPGNHDLWVRYDWADNSFKKLHAIKLMAKDYDIYMEPGEYSGLAIVPLFGWYDYSFGEPDEEVFKIWADYYACKWPERYDVDRISSYFDSLNNINNVSDCIDIISFSHFLPRIDLMPFYIPIERRVIYPVLGSYRIERKIRELRSKVHVYGHSHVNMRTIVDGILYVNNAFGYPYEARITSKELQCVYEI